MNIKQVLPFKWPAPTERTAVLPRSIEIQGRTRNLLDEPDFKLIVLHEDRRAVRSGMAVILVLVTVSERAKTHELHILIECLSACLRQTDCLGWYEDGRVLGLLFTQVNAKSQSSTAELLRSRIVSRLTPAHLDLRVSVMYGLRNTPSETLCPERRVSGGIGA